MRYLLLFSVTHSWIIWIHVEIFRFLPIYINMKPDLFWNFQFWLQITLKKILSQKKRSLPHLKALTFDYFGDKSPKVPFHRITLSYSYFEEFDFLRQFSKKQNMTKKRYQLYRNEKFDDKAQQWFAFSHIKSNFKFAVQWSWFLET